MAKVTSKSPGNLVGAKADFLRLLHTVPRNKRFELMGLINDPDTVAAEKPDQYGLMLDRMKEGTLTWDPDVFGYSSGVLGLQLFANKKFDPQKWSLAKYLEDPGSVEPPYNVGMACGFCHVSFKPTRPPAMSMSQSGRTSARTSATSTSGKECCSAATRHVIRSLPIPVDQQTRDERNVALSNDSSTGRSRSLDLPAA
jgi:hypothetical protein